MLPWATETETEIMINVAMIYWFILSLFKPLLKQVATLKVISGQSATYNILEFSKEILFILFSEVFVTHSTLEKHCV